LAFSGFRQKILRKMNKRRVLKRLNNPRRKDRILSDFNQSTLDPVGPLGGEQGTKLLSEMNSLVDEHEEFVKSLTPKLNVL
jgi:hypothetical protein